MMGRREFVTVLGGMAAWPVVGRAQQPGERMRRIGVFVSVADDSEGQTRIAAFLQALQNLGWTVGHNVQIDYRSGLGDAENIRKYATELVALAPDVIVAAGGPSEIRDYGVGRAEYRHYA